MKDTTLSAIKNDNATLIDVRDADELESIGAIEKAIHIPLMEIPEHLDEIKNYQKPIVIFCKIGGRAGRAKEFLDENGVEEVYNGGGYNDIKEVLEK